MNHPNRYSSWPKAISPLPVMAVLCGLVLAYCLSIAPVVWYFGSIRIQAGTIDGGAPFGLIVHDPASSVGYETSTHNFLASFYMPLGYAMRPTLGRVAMRHYLSVWGFGLYESHGP